MEKEVYIGIYKSDEGWLNFLGEWENSLKFWWDIKPYYKDDVTVYIFNLLVKETKDVLINFRYKGDVKDIWLVPFDSDDQIHWLDAVRLS